MCSADNISENRQDNQDNEDPGTSQKNSVEQESTADMRDNNENSSEMPLDNQDIEILLPQRITLKQTFPIEFFSGSEYPAKEYVYIDEIGDDEFTIITKTELPFNLPISIKFLYNGDFGECTVKVKEKKIGQNSLKKYILSYEYLSPEAGIIITCIAGNYAISARTKRRTLYPKKFFNVQIYSEENEEWNTYFPCITVLSNKGLEYSSKTPIATDKENEFLMKIFFNQREKPIAVGASFLCEQTKESGEKKGWIEFSYIPEQSLKELDAQLIRMAQGEITENFAEPICKFE